MILEHETNFIVMPKNCNWMKNQTLVFGGHMLEQMDLCAAGLIRKILRSSHCNSAVTVGVNDVNFVRGAKAGDLVVLKAVVWNTGKKSIDIKIEGWIDTEDGLLKKCDGMFSWITSLDDVFTPHKLPKIKEGKMLEE